MSWTEIQIAMATNHAGNIMLHVAAILTAGHIAWHLKGIIREVHRMTPAPANCQMEDKP